MITLPSRTFISEEASEGDMGEVGVATVSSRTESSVVLSKEVEQDLSGPSDIASASWKLRVSLLVRPIFVDVGFDPEV